MASDLRTALGLMSGTSIDGVDAAILVTDGKRSVQRGPWTTTEYPTDLRAGIRSCLGGEGPVGDVERAITEFHALAVGKLLDQASLSTTDVDVIGFHGHTILHAPAAGRTWQIGDGAYLASLTGVGVVDDFRSADVAAGGQGAPFASLYHLALAADLDRPLAVLNVGGVANVTWIGPDDEILAFDTGPGNALIDDLVSARNGQSCDRDGRLAAAGKIDQSVLSALLRDPYFERPPPKSLDRDAWSTSALTWHQTEDAAATLTAFTVAAVKRAVAHFPAPATRWLVTGGGRHNPTMMDALRVALNEAVDPVERVGWDGDALEAQAFAYLAVRSLLDLPLSMPGTTGVARPMPGGHWHAAMGP